MYYRYEEIIKHSNFNNASILNSDEILEKEFTKVKAIRLPNAS